ncbi:SapC family protein [Microbulbifer sp. YPW1]|uniref:SapC family protein n=1 Tax=Microbulbifer sp. YPW1 TaxID=2745199 RepID=UPI001598FF10|nr:SapC family protein [Microbulbifer sp. YPW1]QKX17617.1 SapC family protein [Microbulbifer sp. YPW1]
MTNTVLLNNVDHAKLKVVEQYGEAFGHKVGRTVVFPSELEQLQCEYPLLIARGGEPGQYQCVALFGLSADENLFLDADAPSGWDASVLPLVFAKGPFLIGRQEEFTPSGPVQKAVVHVDLDDPRVNTTGGHPLFMDFGGSSPYLEKVQKRLQALDEGIGMTNAFTQVLSELELLEAVALDIGLCDGSNYKLEGYFTVGRERLMALPDETLGQLHRGGYLSAIYALLASLGNVQKLVRRKEAQLAASIREIEVASA